MSIRSPNSSPGAGSEAGEEDLAAQIKDMAIFLFQLQWTMKQIGQSISFLEHEYISLPSVALPPLPSDDGVSLSERLDEVTEHFLAEFRRTQLALEDSEDQMRRLQRLLMLGPNGDVIQGLNDLLDERERAAEREKQREEEMRGLHHRIQERERELAVAREEKEEADRESQNLQNTIETLTSADEGDAILQGIVTAIDKLLDRPVKIVEPEVEAVVPLGSDVWMKRGELFLCVFVAFGFFFAAFRMAMQ
jgi:hypothetical protein